MNYSLEQQIYSFIQKQADPEKGVLLAFSGGPDSLALLHLLLYYQKRHPLKLSLAHVDHGWREESKEEMLQIQEMAEKQNLVLHTITLDPKEMQGNLEASCREARLRFFATLCKEHHYQAVIMGHHADDLAETVLKRVLEGSSLTCLSGLNPVSKSNDLIIWRPLLTVPKQKLLDWLREHALKGFEDRTNFDTRFLRARLRETILPQLSKDFGKEVRSGLCRVGFDSAELKKYLDEKTNVYVDRIVHGYFGKLLDLSRDCPQSPLELKHIIRRFYEVNELVLSKECVEDAARMLQENAADKQVGMGIRRLHIDRKRLFVVQNELPTLPPTNLSLKLGRWEFGPWKVEVSLSDMFSDFGSNWRSFWQGEGEVILPKEDYYLASPKANEPYHRNSPLSKWWSNHKIPAFFRQHVPMIYQNDRLIHEFLTGKVLYKNLDKPQECVKIKLLTASF